MVEPSKKGAKSEAEVAAEAKRKKDILDKVAQSNLPTKTVLKELGISRSTYYSWLKRYEEEGDEGLLDSRSLPKLEEQKEKAPAAAEEVEIQPSEPRAEPVIEKEPVLAQAKSTEVKREESIVKPVEAEPKKREGVVMSQEMPAFGGGAQKKGVGAYALIAVLLLVVGLLVSISLNNYNSFELRKSGETLKLWKGKFAPRGSEMVESFQPLIVGDTDFSALTNRTFAGKDSAYKAIADFFLDQVNREAARGGKADMAKMNRLMDKAEAFVSTNMNGNHSQPSMRFQLAQQRVTIAEMGLQRAYRMAMPIYQEALKSGLGDEAMLEAKVAAMQQVLGIAPAKKAEPAGEEGGVAATPEVSAKEAGTAAAPEMPAVEAVSPPAPAESKLTAQEAQPDEIAKPIENLVERWRGNP